MGLLELPLHRGRGVCSRSPHDCSQCWAKRCFQSFTSRDQKLFNVSASESPSQPPGHVGVGQKSSVLELLGQRWTVGCPHAETGLAVETPLDFRTSSPA